MKKAFLALMVVAAVSMGGCVSALGMRPSYGVVIKNELDMNASTKGGVAGVSNTGLIVFANSHLDPPKVLGRSGGTSSYGGMGVPQWVEVSWRTGDFIQRYDPSTNSAWTGGTVVARHRIEVASRIPPEVLKYASEGKGRAVYLTFRIKDDGVLLGWSVQEMVHFPKGGSGWVWSLHGGDFPCDPMTRYESRPDCTSGYLKDAPWYNPLWTTN
jgi:hypothetical protein